MFLASAFSSLNLPSTRPSTSQGSSSSKTQRRTKFGQHVDWRLYTDGGRHLSPDELETYRFIGDPPLDAILQTGCPNGASKGRQSIGPYDDVVAMAKECAIRRRNTKSSNLSSSEQELADFYQYYFDNAKKWFDVKEVERGRQVFLTYFPAISLSLYYRSLVPGFSIPKIAAVLLTTRYLTPPSTREQVRERLMDTGALLAMATASNGAASLAPGADGWKAALQVRVLHAKVRQRIMSQRGSRKWDTDLNGIPINQEDLAATLLAFSSNALLGCEMIMGRPVPRDDRLAYMTYWRYLGWLLGIPTLMDYESEKGYYSRSLEKRETPRPLDPCGEGWLPKQPDPLEHSYSIFQSIIFHILNPNETSVIIAHHLLRIGQSYPEPKDKCQANGKTTKKHADEIAGDKMYYFRCLQCRRFIGGPLADALQLPFHPQWYIRLWLWSCSTTYLVILRIYTVVSSIAPFRNRIVKFHERQLKRFTSMWQSTHQKRLQTKLKEKKSSAEEAPEGCPISKSESKGVCSFALISPSIET